MLLLRMNRRSVLSWVILGRGNQVNDQWICEKIPSGPSGWKLLQSNKKNNSVNKVILYTPLSSDQQIRKENYVTNKYERVCSTLARIKIQSLCDVH